jgi:hypothetical protein
MIGTQIFILLRAEQVDEDGSLVGSLFWFSWETCWYVSRFELNHRHLLFVLITRF